MHLQVHGGGGEVAMVMVEMVGFMEVGLRRWLVLRKWVSRGCWVYRSRFTEVLMGPLVLVAGHDFAHRGPPRVLGLVVVAKNGSVLVYYYYYYYYYYYLGLLVWIWQWWMLMVVVVVAMAADGLGLGFSNLDFVWVF